ncbi:MAG: ammonium transporter, partial [Plesiomonas shigelloides]
MMTLSTRMLTATAGLTGLLTLPAAMAETAAPVINKADDVWLLVASAMVILMSLPGLALFYGGLVRSKNMLSVLAQVFTVFAAISVLWIVYGYSIAFTEGNGFF